MMNNVNILHLIVVNTIRISFTRKVGAKVGVVP
jgi:hypothetical protein